MPCHIKAFAAHEGTLKCNTSKRGLLLQMLHRATMRISQSEAALVGASCTEYKIPYPYFRKGPLRVGNR